MFPTTQPITNHRPSTTKRRILFLCADNSIHSQMAEALLRKHAGIFFEPYSAGLAGGSIHPLAIQVMDEIQLDIRPQHVKLLSQYVGLVSFGYLITLCETAEKDCPIFPGMGARLYWPCADPTTAAPEAQLAQFRLVRDQIDARIQQWLNEMSIPTPFSLGHRLS